MSDPTDNPYQAPLLEEVEEFQRKSKPSSMRSLTGTLLSAAGGCLVIVTLLLFFSVVFGTFTAAPRIAVLSMICVLLFVASQLLVRSGMNVSAVRDARAAIQFSTAVLCLSACVWAPIFFLRFLAYFQIF